MKWAANKTERKILIQHAKNHPIPRKIVSFYRYCRVEDPVTLRNQIYMDFEKLSILGRVYLSTEGINAHVGVPKERWNEFVEWSNSIPLCQGVFLNESLSSDSTYAFFKLDVRVRKALVAHKLAEDPLATTSPGKHLDPREFHTMLEKKDVVVIDARNKYESDIGHFEGAFLPQSKTFSAALAEISAFAKEHKDKNILMYCTGGIRCETASAFIRKEGVSNVFQLQWGIIHYLRTMQKDGIEPKYKGSLYVFDERMAEAVHRERLGKCQHCGVPHSVHSNCGFIHCHSLMLQCPACALLYEGCCSKECMEKRDLLENSV